MKKLILLIILCFMFFGCEESEQLSSTNKPEYTLQYGKNFNKGMNAVGDMGMSIVIAVDVSGSMSDPPSSGGDLKYIQASKALKTVSDFLQEVAKNKKDWKINVAIIKFSSKVSTVLPFTRLDDKGIAALQKACIASNFEPEGNTAIGSALEAGSEFLAQSGTILNTMIVLTDGENTSGPEPEKIMRAIYSNENNVSTKDFKIITTNMFINFIGFDVQSDNFKGCEKEGAKVTSATDQKELESALKSLIEADITKLE